MLEQRFINLGKPLQNGSIRRESRCSINALMTYTPMAIARSLRKMFAACNAPCSVNTHAL